MFFPRLARAAGGGHLRGGRAAGDPDPVDPELRLGGGVGGVAHDERGGRASRAGDGLAACERAGRRRGRAGRGDRRASPARPTSRPGCGTGWTPSAPPRTPSCCCTTPSGTRSPRQVASLGPGTTLLVDTYDVKQGVATAVEVAGTGLGAVRLDSGDLGGLAQEVRRQLDELGARDTKIVVTSDLDEYAIASLASAPVDVYGVGTSVVTGSGAPTCGMVYKLVARADSSGVLQPVAKASSEQGVGGRAQGRRPALRTRRARQRGDHDRSGRRRGRRGRRRATTCGRCTCRWWWTGRSTPGGAGRTGCTPRRTGTGPPARAPARGPAPVGRRGGGPDGDGHARGVRPPAVGTGRPVRPSTTPCG